MYCILQNYLILLSCLALIKKAYIGKIFILMALVLVMIMCHLIRKNFLIIV